ncbi:hypothetical protein BDW22DRAFT_1210133 [Trametopsis cervina]|nr:hypothetical protein BDW22DRAFT_1210133 [Trametopsis cervina]
MQEYTAQGLWVPSTADTDDLDDIINHIDAVEMRVRESYDDNVWVERAHLLKGLRTQIRSLVYSSENVALLRRRASVVDERKVESSDDVTDQRTVYKWIRLGFNLESAMKIASASIGAEARHFEGHPTYVVAKQAFVSKRVSVALSDLEPSPEFITAVKDAMSSSSPEERKEALDEVMDRWGQFIATSVELGCAVVASKETQNASPQDVVEDLHVRMVTLLGANANNSQDSTPSPASSLPLVFMGGRGIAMRDVASWLNTIDEESGWTTISVLEVHRTIDLIRNLDQELYRQAAEMLATPRPEEALPVSPSPPIYQFDGRITTL